jgi:hypothetical protein
MPFDNAFTSFLIRAKRNTYASGIQPSAASRTASHDLPYQEGEYQYLDTYLGGFHFIGEEAVWEEGVPLWGMNYYGWMLAHSVPDGFGQFLKNALLQVPNEAPYRGPADYRDAWFRYACRWEGSIRRFSGREWIDLEGEKIYELVFHGGEVKE